MPKHLRSLVSQPEQWVMPVDGLFRKYISWPCVIRLRHIYLEEPFVLWKSTCRCQNAFKWVSVRDGAKEVKGQLKGGEGRWPRTVPLQEQILWPAWAPRSEMSLKVKKMSHVENPAAGKAGISPCSNKISWDKYSLIKAKMCQSWAEWLIFGSFQ